MKLFLPAIFCALLLLSAAAAAPSPAFAQRGAEKKAVERLINATAAAFTARNLGSLDRLHRPYRGKIKVVVENSLGMDGDRYETRSFKTLAAAERWLRSREVKHDDGFVSPDRNLLQRVACRKGVCTYTSEGGILHNRLYLKRLYYVYLKGRAFIKTIYLLDGN